MKATQFFVGFGKTLWSVKRGETEYGIKAIPAGGFVKIIGMIPDEEVAESDQPRAFWRQPAPQRIVVLAAGSTMHFVIGGMLILGAAFFQPTVSFEGLKVGVVAHCVQLDQSKAATDSGGSCGANSVTAPAFGVIKLGDVIERVAGAKVTTWDAATKQIRRHAGRPLALVVKRGGVDQELTVTPTAVQRYPIGTDSGSLATVGAIGLSNAETYSAVTYHAGLHRAGTLFGLGSDSIIGSTAKGIYDIPGRFGTLFDKNRPVDGPSSVVGIANFSNQILDQTGQPASYKIWSFLLIVGSVNIFVGVINLFPLLPFDGGHIMLILLDKTREGFARLSRRPIPARIKYSTVAPLSYAVFLVIVIGSLAVLSADIVNPVHL
jgi:membrane-associated protease RseP (regulator of RpoE activity)